MIGSSERFVSQPMRVLDASIALEGMAPGEPGLPRRLGCQGEEHEVAEILARWADVAPCTHGSGERYRNRHWYRVRTREGVELRLYFQRPRAGRTAGWVLYSRSGP